MANLLVAAVAGVEGAQADLLLLLVAAVAVVQADEFLQWATFLQWAAVPPPCHFYLQ